MKRQISPQFRRELEAEVRRLTELQFGQGGDWGRIQRNLDQKMSGLTALYERLHKETYYLLEEMQKLKKLSASRPTSITISRGEMLRLDAQIRDLEQATRAIDQLGAIL